MRYKLTISYESFKMFALEASFLKAVKVKTEQLIFLIYTIGASQNFGMKIRPRSSSIHGIAPENFRSKQID